MLSGQAYATNPRACCFPGERFGGASWCQVSEAGDLLIMKVRSVVLTRESGAATSRTSKRPCIHLNQCKRSEESNRELDEN